jgi:hypothetical protein
MSKDGGLLSLGMSSVSTRETERLFVNIPVIATPALI